MRTYRFTTKISEEGNIQVPTGSMLLNEEVEVIIRQRTQPRPNEMTASEFVNKWRGFLTNVDPEQAKYEYLSDKYR